MTIREIDTETLKRALRRCSRVAPRADAEVYVVRKCVSVSSAAEAIRKEKICGLIRIGPHIYQTYPTTEESNNVFASIGELGWTDSPNECRSVRNNSYC